MKTGDFSKKIRCSGHQSELFKKIKLAAFFSPESTYLRFVFHCFKSICFENQKLLLLFFN